MTGPHSGFQLEPRIGGLHRCWCLEAGTRAPRRPAPRRFAGARVLGVIAVRQGSPRRGRVARLLAAVAIVTVSCSSTVRFRAASRPIGPRWRGCRLPSLLGTSFYAGGPAVPPHWPRPRLCSLPRCSTPVAGAVFSVPARGTRPRAPSGRSRAGAAVECAVEENGKQPLWPPTATRTRRNSPSTCRVNLKSSRSIRRSGQPVPVLATVPRRRGRRRPSARPGRRASGDPAISASWLARLRCRSRRAGWFCMHREKTLVSTRRPAGCCGTRPGRHPPRIESRRGR